MASASAPSTPPLPRLPRALLIRPSSLLLSHAPLPLLALRADASKPLRHAAPVPAVLRRPSMSPLPPPPPSEEGLRELPTTPEENVLPAGAAREKVGRGKRQKGGEEREDWEDLILQDTVPLVGFVRMILHSGKYEIGDRLSLEHEKTIVERLLPYHPNCEKKIESGIDFITIGFHPEFESSRCLFIARKDGEMVDFSYWKCIKGLIRKNYPLYADSFILKHFQRRREH